MRLVDSSDPTAVPRADAMELIYERLVLANAVCAELDACGGQYAESLPRTALGLLRRWVAARYDIHVETHASDGLDKMVVPPGGQPSMKRLRTATHVCEQLATLWTADTRSEFESDSKKVAEALRVWRAGRAE